MARALLLMSLSSLSGCFLPTAKPGMYYPTGQERLGVDFRAMVEESGTRQTYSSGYTQRTPRALVGEATARIAPFDFTDLAVGGCLGLNCGLELNLGYPVFSETQRWRTTSAFAFGGIRQVGLGVATGVDLFPKVLAIEANLFAAYGREVHDTPMVFADDTVTHPLDFGIASIRRDTVRAELPVVLRLDVKQFRVGVGFSSPVSKPVRSTVKYSTRDTDAELARPSLASEALPWRVWISIGGSMPREPEVPRFEVAGH